MRVALVGLGNLGTAIAERIVAAGYPLTVYNRTRPKTESLAALGAEVADAPGGLLSTAAACVTVLADDAALEQVALGPAGLLAGAAPGSLLVDMSTVSRASSARIAAAAETAGVRYLRAPVSGNPTVVRAGNLTIIVSGPAADLEDARPLLETIGPNVYHVGEAEEARVVKLALQVLVGGVAELLGEAIVLGEAGGVDRATLLEVIGNSAVGSPFVKYKSGPLLAEDYSATFTTEMMVKDVELVLGLAEEGGAELPFMRRLGDLLRETIAAGYGDADFMALYLRLRAQALGAAAPTGSEPAEEES